MASPDLAHASGRGHLFPVNSDARGPGRSRQSELFLAGLGGRRPGIATRFDRLEAQAREALSTEAFAYIAGGAGSEDTVTANRRAFDRWRIVPRVLRNVERRDLSTTLLGRRLPFPCLLAPIGVLEMAHPEADLAVARAAAAEGIPLIFSSQASVPMESCAAVMGDGPRWFQLYWGSSDELVRSFLERAEDCGCDAVVLTLDTTLLGWRPRDLDLAYLPFLRGRGLAQYTSDPVFQDEVEQLLTSEDTGSSVDARRAPRPGPATLVAAWQMARRHPGSTWHNLISGRARAAVRHFVASYSRPSLSWDELGWLRDQTALPLLLKGVLHPADAREAVRRGMDGVIVSNHGGRQLDGALASLEALPRVVEAVDGRVPVLFDSGIRGGADVFKALALGATAVCLGRPYAYGLAVGGEAGVREVVANLRAEFDLTLGLAGRTSIAELDASCLLRSPGCGCDGFTAISTESIDERRTEDRTDA